MELRIKDEEIVGLRRPYRSFEFDSILQELLDVKREVDRINLDSIPKNAATLVESIRLLITEKTSSARLLRKNQADINTLMQEVSRLKKDSLDLNSKYISER
jgi:hypothetical protein